MAFKKSISLKIILGWFTFSSFTSKMQNTHSCNIVLIHVLASFQHVISGLSSPDQVCTGMSTALDIQL